MIGSYTNIDRRLVEPSLEPVDAVMLTLDAEQYLEKTLDAVYREVPIARFLVVDGGSKDGTVELLNKYPRMEVMVAPDIKTTGKGLELLFKKSSADWCIFVDNGKVINPGWYDEMCKNKPKYDFFGSKRIVHYEFERNDDTTTDLDKRPLGGPWLIKRSFVKDCHVDDDYMWRVVDLWLRQEVEKKGGVYGFSNIASHTCYISDKEKYKSNPGKSGVKLTFQRPIIQVKNKVNYQRWLDMTSKAIVKYLEPGSCRYFLDDVVFMKLSKLDQGWVKKTNFVWYVEIQRWKRRSWLKAVIVRVLYKWSKAMLNWLNGGIDRLAKNSSM